MALFNRKKSQDATAPAAAPSTQDDFSDFSPEALTADSTDGNAGQPSEKSAEKAGRKSGSGIKPGTAIGLNIGSDSIKVVEATAKGSEITITALASVPTPEDSISNGLVTNPTALATGIRNALTQAGIRSKKVVSSVAGAGGTIVRVFEVQKMSDQELLDNMKLEADRYIPFPPSEVQMDFKALRELPSDPGAENMEVLLAASKRDVIDSHVKVVQAAKLDPRAIDVEPLAVARALTHPLTASHPGAALNGAGYFDEGPDYNDTSAVLDIGANETEISILRGDLLVFTRTIPNGGNSLTQEISDRLHLDRDDAERIKREKGDALLPAQVSAPAADIQSEGEEAEDWSSFSDELFEDAPEGEVTLEEQSPENDTFFGETPQAEPGEQHQQKESEENNDDEKKPADAHSFFDFGEETEPKEKMPTAPQEMFDYLSLFGEEEDEDDADLPTITDEAESASALPSAFDFPDEEDAPLEFGIERLPTRQEKTQDSVFDDPFAAEDAALLPSEAQPDAPSAADETAAPQSTSAESTSAESTLEGEETLPAISFDFNLADTPAEEEPASEAIETDPFAEFMATADTEEAPEAEKVDLSSIPSVADTPAAATPETDIDLDAMFDEDAPAGTEPVPGTDAGTFAPVGVDDFSTGLDDDFADFGAGLSGISADEVTPGLLHEIIGPSLEGLIAEVRRSLEFYTSHRPGSSINRITLVGGGAMLKNIDAYFTQQLGIPTAVGNPLLQLKQSIPSLPANYLEENGTIYTAALGLAMRELTQ